MVDGSIYDPVGEIRFMGFKEVFGHVRSGSNNTGDGAEEEMDEGSITGGEAMKSSMR